MKVETVRNVLEKAASLHTKAGADRKADALRKLAQFLSDHDKESVAAFVKAAKTRQNRAKSAA